MSWNYHTTHWQVTGSYGDHLMFQRLYEKVDEEIDGLAEKLTGLFGNEAVDGPLQAHHMTRFLSNFAAEGDPIIRALNTERAWQAILKRVLDYLDAHGDLGLGLDNMLRTFADDHETHSFLLQQRQGGIRKMATSVKNQDRQRRRAFTARCILKAAGWWSIGEGTTGGGIHPRERQGGGWPVRW